MDTPPAPTPDDIEAIRAVLHRLIDRASGEQLVALWDVLVLWGQGHAPPDRS